MSQSCDLSARRCVPCEGGVPALDDAAARNLVAELDGWTLADGKIGRTFRFGDHH